MAQQILLVNKFYYPRGGDCVVTLNTQSLLRSRGHEKKNGCSDAHAEHE